MTRSPPVRVAYDGLLRDVRARRLAPYRGRPVLIECHDPGAALYGDVVELALALASARPRTWVDRHGRRTAASALPAAALRLTRELAWSAPRALLRHRAAVARLERHFSAGPGTGVPAAGLLDRGLFIRSDHDFDLAAGGSVGHLAGVVEGFRRQGIDLAVLSSDRLPGVPADERFLELTPRYQPVRNVADLALLEYNAQLLGAAAARWRGWRPGFVYHRYGLFSYIGPALRARFDVPYVCEFNGPIVWIARHWDGRLLFFPRLANRIETLNMRAANLVVVVSEPLAREAVRRGADPARVLVDPNGVDVARYAPDVSGAGVRQRYGLEDAFVVGFIGTFGPWHGAEKLVEAAAALCGPADLDPRLRRRLRFLLIGDGVRMPAVRALIARHGLQDVVRLTGLVPQADGPAYLAACDVLTAPHVPNPDGSPFFGSPTKLFEYMAMGRAIVASDLGQIGEVLEDGATALLVPPGDVPALAAAIVRLASDEPLRLRLGAAARERAVREHTWDMHTRRITRALAALAPAATPAEATPSTGALSAQVPT
jgi:glycosyltransferase involved in cell wall biosynthesis